MIQAMFEPRRAIDIDLSSTQKNHRAQMPTRLRDIVYVIYMTALFPLVLRGSDRLSSRARLRNCTRAAEFVVQSWGLIMHKRLLVTSALASVMFVSVAQAADLPRKAPIMKAPVAAPFSWTGFYIGGHVGGGWGDKKWSDWFDPINGSSTVGPDASYHVSGVLGGGQIGYNWQSGWTVFGIEADASAASIKGSGNNDPFVFIGPGVVALTGSGCLDLNGACTTKIEALGTITARLGAAVDRVLFYAKGGAAWEHEKHTVRAFDLLAPNDPLTNFTSTTSETRWGWTAGAGIEYAFTNNWSAKIEYNYLDFGKDQVAFTLPAPTGFGVGGTLHQTLHVVKGGLNYRFGY